MDKEKLIQVSNKIAKFIEVEKPFGLSEESLIIDKIDGIGSNFYLSKTSAEKLILRMFNERENNLFAKNSSDKFEDGTN